MVWQLQLQVQVFFHTSIQIQSVAATSRSLGGEHGPVFNSQHADPCSHNLEEKFTDLKNTSNLLIVYNAAAICVFVLRKRSLS